LADNEGVPLLEVVETFNSDPAFAQAVDDIAETIANKPEVNAPSLRLRPRHSTTVH
jgi:hypothetical protein